MLGMICGSALGAAYANILSDMEETKKEKDKDNAYTKRREKEILQQIERRKQITAEARRNQVREKLGLKPQYKRISYVPDQDSEIHTLCKIWK